MSIDSYYIFKRLALTISLFSLIFMISCASKTTMKSEGYTPTCKNYNCHIDFSKKIKRRPAIFKDYLDSPRVLEKSVGGAACFDASENDICFDCHNKAMVTDHAPENVTGFQDGKVNLHFKHFNSAGFKVKSCNVCHDIHSSVQPKFITYFSIDADDASRCEANLTFTPTETGGSCETVCHKTYGYDRAKPSGK